MLGEVEPFKDMSITHGICQACEKKLMKEVEAMEKK